jgi:hypothetical protein
VWFGRIATEPAELRARTEEESWVSLARRQRWGAAMRRALAAEPMPKGSVAARAAVPPLFMRRHAVTERHAHSPI